MASSVAMRHRESGILKTGYFGFSWTSLFFGFFPALFRGDYITFLGGFTITCIVAVVTFGIGALVIGVVWAFIYNKHYTRKLLERGYIFDDTAAVNMRAAAALGVSSEKTSQLSTVRG